MIWPIISIGAMALITILGLLLIRDAWQLKGGIILLALIVVVAQIFVIRAEIREKEVSRYAGVLEGKPITILSARQQVYPKLQLGNSKSILVWQGPKGEPIMRVFEDTDLTIWIENGALKISTKIRNKKGEMVAELIGNEWKAKPEKIWDRNYSDNALEVIDDTGDVILQVVLKEALVQFAAKMYSSTGQAVGLGSAEDPKLGVVGVIEVRPPGQPLELSIEPIFKYPSELHLGELKGR